MLWTTFVTEEEKLNNFDFIGFYHLLLLIYCGIKKGNARSFDIKLNQSDTWLLYQNFLQENFLIKLDFKYFYVF